MSQAKKGLLVLSMIDKGYAFAIPFEVLDPHWDELYQTVLENGRVYKHLLTYEANGKFNLRIRGIDHQLGLEPYRI